MVRFIFVIALILFILQSLALNKREIWFSNMDQDSMMIVGSMDVNAGRKPLSCEHPALGTYYVYGIFLRLFDMLNILSVSDSTQLSLLKDPLSILPGIYYAGRVISIIIAMICAIFTKVQILPFLFLVPTVIFEFVRSNRKKFIRVFSYQVIIYCLSIGFLIVFLLFINNLLPEKQFYRTIIIVVYIVALSLWLRLKAGMQDLRMACFLTNFFAVGILLSVIFTLNYFNYDLNSKKVLANQFFPLGTSRIETLWISTSIA